MVETNGSQNLAKARTFFEKALKVAEKNNFDYAIDMFLEGLRCAPDALHEGHLKLYALALRRKEEDIGNIGGAVSRRVGRGRVSLPRNGWTSKPRVAA